MLEVKNLNASIGKTDIIRDVNIHVSNNQMCGLIGRNGAGKTTFMRSIMGHVNVSGTVIFNDLNLTGAKPHRRAELGIGYMPEDRKLVPEFTVNQNILLPVWSVNVDDWEEHLEWIYSLMPEIEQFRGRKALELSGGQQKLVALARALMAGRKFLLLDEPFEGLAPALAQRLGEVMNSLKSEGVSMLVSDSTEHHLEGLLDNKYVIERGCII